jgi:hypothetical protein
MSLQEISIAEMARETQLFPEYFYRLLKCAKLRGEKRDGVWHVQRSDYRAWLKTHRFQRKRNVEQSAREVSA